MNLTFLYIEDDLNFFENGRVPQENNNTTFKKRKEKKGFWRRSGKLSLVNVTECQANECQYHRVLSNQE